MNSNAPIYWILDGRLTVPVSSLEEWVGRFSSANRHVGENVIGGVRVSTVFLGVDHNHFGKGDPVLFETMIFGGEHDGYQERCSTYAEAEKMHATACELVHGTAH